MLVSCMQTVFLFLLHALYCLFFISYHNLSFLFFICFLSFYLLYFSFFLYLTFFTFRQRIQFTRVLLINSRIQTMDVKLLLFKFVYFSSFCMVFFSVRVMCVSVPKVLIFHIFQPLLFFYLTSLNQNMAIFSRIGWTWLNSSIWVLWNTSMFDNNFIPSYRYSRMSHI